jgi:anti-sigma factor RsiW
MTFRRWLPWRRREAVSPPGGLVCRDAVELVGDYLEAALDARDRARFDAHLAGCDRCSVYLQQMRMTVRVVGHIEPDELDPETERALLDAFKDWNAGGA